MQGMHSKFALSCFIFFCLVFQTSSALASDYVSCLSEKLQGITHDAAVKAITEACRAQYPNTAATKTSSAPVKALIEGRYRDNGDGTITDVKTNLTWQRCSVGQHWNVSTCKGEAAGFNWGDAMMLAKDGWRLPTKEELDTLVFCSSGQRRPSERQNGRYAQASNGRCEGNFTRPTINQQAFPNMSSRWFWSSSPDVDDSDGAWGVSFAYGAAVDHYKYNDYGVRFVRSGQ